MTTDDLSAMEQGGATAPANCTNSTSIPAATTNASNTSTTSTTPTTTVTAPQSRSPETASTVRSRIIPPTRDGTVEERHPPSSSYKKSRRRRKGKSDSHSLSSDSTLPQLQWAPGSHSSAAGFGPNNNNAVGGVATVTARALPLNEHAAHAQTSQSSVISMEQFDVSPIQTVLNASPSPPSPLSHNRPRSSRSNHRSNNRSHHRRHRHHFNDPHFHNSIGPSIGSGISIDSQSYMSRPMSPHSCNNDNYCNNPNHRHFYTNNTGTYEQTEAVPAVPVVETTTTQTTTTTSKQLDVNQGCSLICECCKLNVDTTTAKGRLVLYGSILFILGLFGIGVVLVFRNVFISGNSNTNGSGNEIIECPNSCFPDLLINGDGVVIDTASGEPLCQCYCYDASLDYKDYQQLCQQQQEDNPDGSSSTPVDDDDWTTNNGVVNDDDDDWLIDNGECANCDDEDTDDFYDDFYEYGTCPTYCYIAITPSNPTLPSRWNPTDCDRSECYNSHAAFRKRYDLYLDRSDRDGGGDERKSNNIFVH